MGSQSTDELRVYFSNITCLSPHAKDYLDKRKNHHVLAVAEHHIPKCMEEALAGWGRNCKRKTFAN